MTNFKHSGATGDLIFSLPTIRQMGGGNLFIVPYSQQRAESVAKLLRTQDYIKSVTVTSEPPAGCIDLDLFRKFAGHHENLIEAHFKGQGLVSDKSYKNGWVSIKDDFIKDYTFSVISTGANYHDPNFNWAKEVDYLLTISDYVYFLGYQDEYNLFQDSFGTKAMYWDCDFLAAAQMINAAEMYTGGYTGLTTIAQALGRTYRIVQAPGHTCSSLFIDREKIVN